MILKSQHEFMAWRVNQMIEEELGIASGLFSSCTTQSDSPIEAINAAMCAVKNHQIRRNKK